MRAPAPRNAPKGKCASSATAPRCSCARSITGWRIRCRLGGFPRHHAEGHCARRSRPRCAGRDSQTRHRRDLAGPPAALYVAGMLRPRRARCLSHRPVSEELWPGHAGHRARNETLRVTAEPIEAPIDQAISLGVILGGTRHQCHQIRLSGRCPRRNPGLPCSARGGGGGGGGATKARIRLVVEDAGSVFRHRRAPRRAAGLVYPDRQGDGGQSQDRDPCSTPPIPEPAPSSASPSRRRARGRSEDEAPAA